ncbi:MAG: iron ABC transporter permease [Deferribacteres bacterium]|nr:iron ABC transporter permease [Deferribacteres bacterium]
MRLVLPAALVLAFIAAISTGAVKIDLFSMSEMDRNILFDVRLPRVLLAGLVGAALALSGVLFQYVMKNPLADSFTTGVSASSAMGAVIAIMLGLMPYIPLFALAGGISGLYLVYRIASYRGRIQPITMLLAGIVLSTFASATISFMKFLSDDAVSSIIFWLMGGFQAATPLKDLILFAVICLSFLSVRGDYLKLDILCFDDTTASSTGVDVNRLRKKLFFAAALLTAFSVGYAGIIGFVGLIIPHILRLGNLVRASYLLPASLTGGAAFMMATDLVARTILQGGQELPVGVITSSIGGVFFLYLLIKRRKELFYFN